jgi:hypothetical protein
MAQHGQRSDASGPDRAQHGQRTGRRAPLGMIRRQRSDASAWRSMASGPDGASCVVPSDASKTSARRNRRDALTRAAPKVKMT